MNNHLFVSYVFLFLLSILLQHPGSHSTSHVPFTIPSSVLECDIVSLEILYVQLMFGGEKILKERILCQYSFHLSLVILGLNVETISKII